MQSISPEDLSFEPPPKKCNLSPGRGQNPLKKQSIHSIMMASDSGNSLQIFRTRAEIPAFFVSYRWWEDEATTVFWAFDIQEISRVIRFGLFRDENFPRTSLRSRNADTIDTFLIALSEPHEYQLLDSLSHMQRVEEILRRSSIPPFEAIPWSWFPPQSSPTLDALEIATAIETESHLHFSRIDFEEFVRAALGYNALFIDWFLQQHTALYLILLNHLQAHPEDVPLYANVEKVCTLYSIKISRQFSPDFRLTSLAPAVAQSLCTPSVAP